MKSKTRTKVSKVKTSGTSTHKKINSKTVLKDEQPTAKTVVKEKKDKDKKNTSLRLDKKTLKSLKILAIEKETSIQKLIENLIHEYIEEHRD